MPRLSTKVHLLDDAGYAYNFDRMMYINRRAKKAFSIEFIDDNPETRIQEKIQQPNQGENWDIYTNLPMSDALKVELEKVLQ
jgi:hypothetical protein